MGGYKDMKLKVIIHEAEDGCLSIDIKNTEITEKDRVMEIAV